MDERELEARLSRRLHARFDTGAAPAALHDRVIRSLTAETVPAGGGWLARLTLPRQLVTVAAVVAVVALIALTLRFTQTPVPVTPGGSPTPSATSTTSAGPSATPVPSPSTGLGGTVPPVSTTAWTGVTVQALTGAPVSITNLFSWSGGYLAIAQPDPNAAQTAWLSRDGRTWTQLPASTLGLDSVPFPDGISVTAGSACGSGLIVSTQDTAGHNTVWSSGDGTTWTKVTLPGAPIQFAATSSNAVAVTTSGSGSSGTTSTVYDSSDCSNWAKVALPGPAGGSASVVAAFNGGFVAAGGVGPIDGGPTTKPLAWWSTDGQHWTAATVPSSPGFAFDELFAGPGGLLAETTDPGVTPGTTKLWTSSDGLTWKPQPDSFDPLGVQSTGEGVGNPNGSFAGDGARLRVFGNTTFAGTVPNQLWTSADAVHWTQVAVAGPEGATVLDPARDMQAFLMRDGVLFSDATDSWFGTSAP
jgi:hypothetical protein